MGYLLVKVVVSRASRVRILVAGVPVVGRWLRSVQLVGVLGGLRLSLGL